MDEKTILVVCPMFTRNQTVMVISKDDVIEKTNTVFENVGDVINKLAVKYSIKTINIKGTKMFTKKIGSEIQQKGLTEYNNKLVINLIK